MEGERVWSALYLPAPSRALPDGIHIASQGGDHYLRPPSWFACSEPERPVDPHVIWHYATPDGVPCRGCAIKAGLLLAAYPADTHVAWLLTQVHPTLERIAPW